MNISNLRSETPGCLDRIHLNNAGAALMPSCVVKVIQDYIALESRIGGYEAYDARHDEINAAYRAVAALLGTQSQNIAFTENATVSYAQTLSAIPFTHDDVLLTTNNDYVSNQIQFLSLQKRFGVQVLRAPDLSEGGVDVQAMADLIRRRRPKLVSVTHIPTNSGLIQDVYAIGKICREENVLYLVDACQSIGQMPVYVNEIGCDFLAATSRKFLRGPRGSGFLYVSNRVLQQGLEPLFLDLRGADWTAKDDYRIAGDAKRFENWESAWALVLGTGEAARYAKNIGLEKIQTRVKYLAEQLREKLGAIEGVRVLDEGKERGGIVTVWVEGWEPIDLMTALRKRRINVSAQTRSSAVIDYGRKGVTGALRLSPHYYNAEEEIEQAVLAIQQMIDSDS